MNTGGLKRKVVFIPPVLIGIAGLLWFARSGETPVRIPPEEAVRPVRVISAPAVFDLSDDLRQGKSEVRLRLREGSLALGLDASQIASQLRAAYFGEVVNEIQAGPESYEIDVPALYAILQDFGLTTVARAGEAMPVT